MARRRRRAWTEEEKAAISQSRIESQVVKEYLESLESAKPIPPGRRRRMESRLAVIDGEIGVAPPLERLRLVQERRNLRAAHSAIDNGPDMRAVEDRFVEVAKSFAVRLDIEYASWREVGVPAAVLSRAGIRRQRTGVVAAGQ